MCHRLRLAHARPVLISAVQDTLMSTIHLRHRAFSAQRQGTITLAQHMAHVPTHRMHAQLATRILTAVRRQRARNALR